MKKGVCAVVGVGVGIGGETAKLFAREGYKVAIFARNQNYKGADKLSPLEKDIRAMGGDVFAQRMDASNPIEVEQSFKKMMDHFKDHSLDVLIYNCGARDMAQEMVENVSPEKFLNYWKVNCFGAFLCSQAVVPKMKQQRFGTIIFTGATAALRGNPGLTSFSPGKFGLRSLSQSISKEVSEFNIHVAHVIVDGPVDIPLVRKFTSSSAAIPLISPLDVAKTYLYLHNQTNSSSWTTEMDLVPRGAKL